MPTALRGPSGSVQFDEYVWFAETRAVQPLASAGIQLPPIHPLAT